MQLLSSCLSGLSACLEAERYAFVWVRDEIGLDTGTGAAQAMTNLRAFEQWLNDRPHECRRLVGQLPFVQGETLATLRATVKPEARDEREGELILASFWS